MSEGKRPSGLTVLAVCNLIFAAFGLLNLLVNTGFILILEGIIELPQEKFNEVMVKIQQEFADKVAGGTGISMKDLIYFSLLDEIVKSPLLLLSGIGYLKQKKFLGRTLGTFYGISALLLLACNMAIFSGLYGGFSLLAIILALYPIATLALINTTFKEDFVR